MGRGTLFTTLYFLQNGSNNLECCVQSRLFQLSQMFVGKVRSLPWSGAYKSCFTSAGSCLTWKQWLQKPILEYFFE
jgi:hypothetical protein